MARNDGLTISPLYVEEVEFKGVNSKNDLANAEMIMMERIRRSWMDAGVIMQLPDTIYIEEGVKFEGECIVENGARLCGNTLIVNSHIKAHSVIEDSTVKNSDVGPLAHLRPLSDLKKYQTIIGKNVFVGSDTQLVAPVEIADNVMIAAGTTVTAGKYESDILILSRTPIRKVAGFFTKFFGKGKVC
jgi:bifunctional UDP-N-acetylglucosamine pyrophosphorylase/glucosamine-1-phosphate N-acetyltransferase